MKRNREKYRRMKRIVLYLQGGAIQGASDLPSGVEVEIRDYDTEGADQHSRVKRDEDGDLYESIVIGGPMKRARRKATIRRTRIRAAAPALLRACKKLHDALSEFLEFPDERDVDRKAALRAIKASFAALKKAEPEAFGDGEKQSTVNTKGDVR